MVFFYWPLFNFDLQRNKSTFEKAKDLGHDVNLKAGKGAEKVFEKVKQATGKAEGFTVSKSNYWIHIDADFLSPTM